MGSTWQKQTILDCLKQANGHHVTVDDVMEQLARDGKKVSKATVYRYLKELEQDGELQRYCNHDGQSACYRYVAHGTCNHCHLRCDSCGTLFHMELLHSAQVTAEALAHYGFTIDEHRTVFYGRCAACKREGEPPVI